jgi:elongation factor G
MKTYETPNLRNLAVIGHGDTGKTSLVSALLYGAGAVTRLGSVDDGTAVTDYDEEEHERKITLTNGIAHLEYGGVKTNLVDTPGYANFIGDVRAGLRAADAVLTVVSGVDGVQVQTDRTWRWAEEEGIGGFFVVNMLDRERADFQRVLAGIQESFSRTAVPIAIPIGSEHDLKGVISLLDMKTYLAPPEGSATSKPEPIPGDLADAASSARSVLIEMVAEGDESLMEKFFEAGELSDEDLRSGLRAAVCARQIFPVLPSSATHMVGIGPLLDAVLHLAPSPVDRGSRAGVDDKGDEVACAPDPGGPLAMQVFKTLSDQFGTLSVFRVHCGTAKKDMNVQVFNRSTSERLGNLLVLNGREQTQVEAVPAGDIGAVAKLKNTHTGDSLGNKSNPTIFPSIPFPEPIISFAIEPKAKGEEEKIAQGLHRIAQEDSMIRFTHDTETGDQLISGMGTEHVRVVVNKMQRRYGVEAILHAPKVPYKETLKRKSEKTARHKKQSGGRGQFAECKIMLEPLARGSGYEFVDKIFGGSISQGYRPAVNKGIQETAARGYLAGFPVVDFRVTLLDGKEHSVDSSEMAFKIAGSIAFKEAIAECGPIILEPVMEVAVTAPEDCMGDLMGDLSSRRGRVQGMDSMGSQQMIRAQVPMAEMLEYASTLKSITSDRGSYTMTFSHYEEVPAQAQEKIIAEAKAAKEAGT